MLPTPRRNLIRRRLFIAALIVAVLALAALGLVLSAVRTGRRLTRRKEDPDMHDTLATPLRPMHLELARQRQQMLLTEAERHRIARALAATGNHRQRWHRRLQRNPGIALAEPVHPRGDPNAAIGATE